MPGIVGIWDPSASSDEIARTLRVQTRAVRSDSASYREHRHLEAGFGAVLQESDVLDNGPQPALSSDGRFALLLDGEIFNLRELEKLHRIDRETSPWTAARACLDLLTLRGDQVLRELNGQYCIMMYDRIDKRLTVVTDRFGFRPFFSAKTRSGMLFASNLRGIRAADPHVPRLDHLGIAELFCYGTHVRKRSWIRGYRRLGPATVLTVAPTGGAEHRYWRYRFDEATSEVDIPTYFTVFAKLLDRAVERRMVGERRIGIFLSGGYDSRAIAAAIRREHLPIPAFTFGHPDSRDARFGKMLADRLGFHHRLLTTSGPCLQRLLSPIARRTEGMIPFVQNTSIAHHAAIKDKADLILTGFLGEYSGSHTWPRLLRSRSRRTAMEVVFDRMVSPRLAGCRRIFSASFFDPQYERMKVAFERSFASLDNEHPLNLSDSWDFRFRHPWSYQAAAVDRPLLEVRAPQLDIELVEFLLQIPWRVRLEQRVYKKMIAYSYPEIRDVPCTNSARPIDPNFVREYAKMASRYAMRKAWEPVARFLGRPRPLGREISDVAEELRAEPGLLADVLRPMVAEGVFEPEIFDPSGILAVAQEHYERKAGHQMLLALLLSWGTAKKSLLHGEAVATEY